MRNDAPLMWPVSVLTGTGGGPEGAGVAVVAAVAVPAGLVACVAGAVAGVDGGACEPWETCPAEAVGGVEVWPGGVSGGGAADWTADVWARAIPAVTSGNRTSKATRRRARIK